MSFQCSGGNALAYIVYYLTFRTIPKAFSSFEIWTLFFSVIGGSMPVGFFYSSIQLSVRFNWFVLSVLDLSILNRRQSKAFFCVGLYFACFDFHVPNLYFWCFSIALSFLFFLLLPQLRMLSLLATYSKSHMLWTKCLRHF